MSTIYGLDDQGNRVSVQVATTASGPAARFARITYANQPGTPGRYQLLDMQSGTPSPATATIAAARGAGSTVLTYAAVAVLIANTNDSVTRLPANVTYPDSCYLKDSSGARVVNGNATYMNLADPTWQGLAAKFCSSMVSRVSSDGIYLDELATAAFWQQGLPHGVLTDQQLQDGWVGMITAIKQALAGKLLVGNIGGGAVVGTIGGAHLDGRPVWQRYINAGLDGATEESWGVGTSGQPLTIANQWLYSLQNAAWCEANGKLMICNGDDLGNDTLAAYGLCSMLLVAGGRCMFNESRGQYTAPERWLPVYDQARSLGAPLDPPQLAASSSGLYVRRFQGGTVVVNSTAGSITDPTFGTVPAHTGTII